jgi:uridine kinase
MREIVSTNYPIEKLNMNRLKMINYYQQMKQYDKAELLKYISNTFITIYRLDDVYDYMYGEMAINTSYIKYFNLEYLDDDGCVLMLPFTYDDNKVSYYVHHKKLFNSIMDYLNWSHKIGISNFPDINRLLTEGKWTDLVLMCESNQNKKLMDIAHDIATNKRKIVLISGPSCSGKTTTSKKLKLFLEGEGVKAYMLSVDDYFKERDETPLDENGHKDYESIRAVDTKLFNKQMTQLLDGEEVLLPTYNFVTGKKEYSNKLKMNKTDILIIEGLHSLNDSLTDEISSDKKYRIYISPLTCLNLDNHNRLNTTDNRLLRRIVRDYQTRGYNASQTLECWDRVRRGETKYIFPYQDSADVVLNTSLSYEISALKVYAEPLLFSVKDDDPNYKEAIRLINMLRMILPMPSEGIPLDSIMREFIGNGCFDE